MGCYNTRPDTDIYGNLIPLEAECEFTADYTPLEVDFGRLNASRTSIEVLNNRFDEVILAIKSAVAVSIDLTDRLKLTIPFTNDDGVVSFYEKVIDAPLENLAVYKQIMQYGHLQTDPNVSSVVGDEVVYRPALSEEDYQKFAGVEYLLPAEVGSTKAEYIDNSDLSIGASCLAAAADKTGYVLVDTVVYLNTTLGIVGNNNVLPGNPGYFNFRNFGYQRANTFGNTNITVLQPVPGTDTWANTVVSVSYWLGYANGTEPKVTDNIGSFVERVNDYLRLIEFVHNYEIPADLWGAYK